MKRRKFLWSVRRRAVRGRLSKAGYPFTSFSLWRSLIVEQYDDNNHMLCAILRYSLTIHDTIRYKIITRPMFALGRVLENFGR
jgi:hypothetical protein